MTEVGVRGRRPERGEPVVVTRALRKTYRTRRGRRVAVHGLDMDVPAGGVHAFLGPNGSGKTTTIRMLLGLARADSGSMHLFGQEVPDALPDVVGRVGAIVESPTFSPRFSGRLNLQLLARAIDAPGRRIEEVLDATGLGERGGDRFGAYSLGMKQRLAIAATLLKDPDLLIFDEPTNGLDPAGIRDIRTTMRRLADEGRTVLVSSHVLAEVEPIADTVSIIGRGAVVAQGSVSDLLGQGQGAVEVGIGRDWDDTTRDLLRRDGWTLGTAGDARLLRIEGASDPAVVNRLLAAQGIYADHLRLVRPDLESTFLALTADEQAPQESSVPPPPTAPEASPGGRS